MIIGGYDHRAQLTWLVGILYTKLKEGEGYDHRALLTWIADNIRLGWRPMLSGPP